MDAVSALVDRARWGTSADPVRSGSEGSGAVFGEVKGGAGVQGAQSPRVSVKASSGSARAVHRVRLSLAARGFGALSGSGLVSLFSEESNVDRAEHECCQLNSPLRAFLSAQRKEEPMKKLTIKTNGLVVDAEGVPPRVALAAILAVVIVVVVLVAGGVWAV